MMISLLTSTSLGAGTEVFARAKHHLHYAIRQEKSSFEERIDIRDFFRVFVVEPQRIFSNASRHKPERF